MIQHVSSAQLPPRPSSYGNRVAFAILLALAVGLYVLSLRVAEVSFGRLWEGLPRLAAWLARSWPPDTTELGTLVQRAAETVAMGTVGTSFGVILAGPICVLAARNISPLPLLLYPARTLLNVLRGIDAFVFALIFVAAVGLGPFAGVIGLTLHAAGSIAKLWADAIETIEPGPIEAVTMTGANRVKVIIHAVLPDVMPSLSSITLYMWEWSVRASTVLGVVGAGGIGQELKNSVDLLQFDRVITILALILIMVTGIDAASAWLRRRLI